MTIEQISSVLGLVADKLFDMGALDIATRDKKIAVQFLLEDFKAIPGEVVVSHRECRECSEYPFKLSKTVAGVEFFCVVEEVVDFDETGN
ncbi:hypothetical protein M7775_17180 [Sporomusa sphaeroides DSM 2875]|uniref:hypothetical protein n=1 Tax=Sporomusa sphaeroides TaxID=47679 RepID=UPI002030B352|nr:hypothetical protein [Sporomusa sphaeroides]MCM0760289.1 hypothetical protein [Sporomusa sphaeroides DSM 2875]